MQTEELDKAARALLDRRRGVALTGAGISVDSGIPDFRSAGGLWERFDPMDYATIDAFLADPARVWTMLVELERLVSDAKPNPGHEALAQLAKLGVLEGIITQNIDNLHQRAGSQNVVEFHGNGSWLRCLACGNVEDSSRRDELGMPPTCSCGQVLKPDVVFFGERIPQGAMAGALELTQLCQVMLVVGTSATVAPASMFPLAARRGGALLVEFNLEPTEITNNCDITVFGNASETLPALVDRVTAMSN